MTSGSTKDSGILVGSSRANVSHISRTISTFSDIAHAVSRGASTQTWRSPPASEGEEDFSLTPLGKRKQGACQGATPTLRPYATGLHPCCSRTPYGAGGGLTLGPPCLDNRRLGGGGRP